MKTLKNIAFTLVLLFLGSQAINAQYFIKTVGQAADVAISPKDGSVYVVNASGNVKKYNSKTKNYSSYGKQTGAVKSIAVHPNGTLYMVSKSKDFFYDVKGHWNKVPGIKVLEVDINKKGSVRVLTTSGRVFYYYNGLWKPHAQANTNTAGFNQFVTAPNSKDMYARFKDNAFKQFKSGKWQTLNGNPLRIAIDNANGDVYAVGRNKGIYKWNSLNKKWILLKNTRKDFAEVAVYNGKIWATTTNKNIYYYDNTNSIGVSKNYVGTYRVSVLELLSSYSKEKNIYGTAGVYLESKTESGLISIKPQNSLPNRFLDIPQGKPIAVPNKRNTVVDKYLNLKGENDSWKAYAKINEVREFKLAGDAANSSATFDIQSNLKEKSIGKDFGGYHRYKLKLRDVDFGKKYYFYSSSIGTIVFMIEKL